MKMTQTQLDNWIEALLSGKYKQGKHLLHSVNRKGEHAFCCLGVLCETSIGNTIPIVKQEEVYVGNHDRNTAIFFRYNGDGTVLPNSLDHYFESYRIHMWDISCLPTWRKLYLRLFKGNFFDHKQMKAPSLETMNDSLGLSFKEIAVVLRHNVIIEKELAL